MLTRIFALTLFALLAITATAHAAIIENLDADISLLFPTGSASVETLSGNITLTKTSFPGSAPYELDGTNILANGNPVLFTAHFSKQTLNTFYFIEPIIGLHILTFDVDDIWNPTISSFTLDNIIKPVGGNVTITNETINPVPLPAALPLFGAALAGLGGAGWIKRRKVSRACL